MPTLGRGRASSGKTKEMTDHHFSPFVLFRDRSPPHSMAVLSYRLLPAHATCSRQSLRDFFLIAVWQKKKKKSINKEKKKRRSTFISSRGGTTSSTKERWRVSSPSARGFASLLQRRRPDLLIWISLYFPSPPHTPVSGFSVFRL